LALDEPRENDVKAEEKGYNFCIEQALLDQIGQVTVDFTYMGFSVTPQIPLQGGGGCRSCAVGGSCG
jgi:hypothetical protein